jgi:hypothetical protein
MIKRIDEFINKSIKFRFIHKNSFLPWEMSHCSLERINKDLFKFRKYIESLRIESTLILWLAKGKSKNWIIFYKIPMNARRAKDSSQEIKSIIFKTWNKLTFEHIENNWPHSLKLWSYIIPLFCHYTLIMALKDLTKYISLFI